MKHGVSAAIFVLGVLCPHMAEAATRDDVMSGVFRCAAIGSGRQWLDCYYGAAQPLRAQLGLPPAPREQVALATAPPAGGAMATEEAHARDRVMSEALRCTNVPDDRQWLDCYYGSAQPMRAQLNLSPAPQARNLPGPAAARPDFAVATPPPPPAPSRSGGFFSSLFGSDEKVPAQQFGLEAPASRAVAQNVDHVVARIATYTFDQYGIVTLKLANGEVWRQVEGDTALAKLKLPPDRYVATIKHGFFGSYNLTINNVPGLFRVHRVA